MLQPIYDIDIPVCHLHYYVPTKEDFLAIQEFSHTPYYETPLEARLEIAVELTPWTSSCPDLARIAMCQVPISPAVSNIRVSTESSKDSTWLCAVAGAVGKAYRDNHHEGNIHPKILFNYSMTIEWRVLLRELISYGADLHAIFVHAIFENHNLLPDRWVERTPFLHILGESTHWNIRTHLSQYVCLANQMMDFWLDDLESTGVDLLEFGHVEEAIHDRLPTVSKQFSFYLGEHHDLFECNLLGFTYGPSRSDWHIWMLEPTDSFAGEFWSMIESPEEEDQLVVPGMWIG